MVQHLELPNVPWRGCDKAFRRKVFRTFLPLLLLGLTASWMLSAIFAIFAPLVDAAIHGSFRADVFNNDFPEHGCPTPSVGGRVQIVLSGVPAGTKDADLSSVKINGIEGLNLDTSSTADLSNFDWLRAHADPITGEAWISFHSRNKGWFQSTTEDNIVNFDVGLRLANGLEINGTAHVVQSTSLTLTHVAFRNGGAEAVLHVHSQSTSTHELTNLLFDHQKVDIPNGKMTVPPGGHAIFVVKTQGKITTRLWTAILFTDSGAAGIAYGGRAANERFPMMVWPKSVDCPLPGGNNTNAEELTKLGIDSVFYKDKDFKKCSGGKSLVDEAKAWGGTHFVFTDDKTAAAIPDSVDAVFLGDEVDGGVDADHLRSALKESVSAMKTASKSITYQGAKTNHNIGAFAGMTDVQGVDAYCAACAPTMLAVDHKLPITYPYAYLRNARDNQMPQAFWGYAQLYSEAWSYQANANELIAQTAMVLLSGSKALMLFQSNQVQFGIHKVGEIRSVFQVSRIQVK
jgi:hypothetical protein